MTIWFFTGKCRYKLEVLKKNPCLGRHWFLFIGNTIKCTNVVYYLNIVNRHARNLNFTISPLNINVHNYTTLKTEHVYVYVCRLYSISNVYTARRKQSIIRFLGRVLGESSRTLCYFHRHWMGS